MSLSTIRSFVFSAGVAIIGISLSTSPALAQPFGTGTDIYWAQSNGNPTAATNSGGSSSDPTNFSVDGLWNDTLSTGYTTLPVAAGTFPSINWSTSSAGTPVPSTIPGSYPGTSPNASDPGFIPGSPGHTNVDVVFDATDGNNSTSAIEVNYSPTVQGLYITNIGKVTEIRTDTNSDPQTITIGSDGLNIENTVATSPKQVSGNNILFGNTGAPLTIALSASQTWLNNTQQTSAENVQDLVMSGPIMLAPGVNTPVTVNLSAPGDGFSPGNFPANNHLNGTITDNTSIGGVMSFDVTSGQWTFGAGGTPPAPSTFSGGVTIEAGAQAKDLYATGMGTGTITIKSGGTLYANSNATAVTNTTYANPIVLAGVGTSGTGINGFTTVGAIESMNSGGGSSTITETLTGGMTLTGNALIEALDDPIIITTGSLNLDGNVLTLAAGGPVKNGSNTNTLQMSISSSIVDGTPAGGGVTVNTVPGTLAAGGTITLSGNNSYTGPTTVAKGTLALSTGGNNNIANSATINVMSGGTLDVTQVTGSGGFTLAGGQTLTGEGTVTGPLLVAATSHLDPGGPAGTIGTLTTGATTLQSGSILDYEFSTTPSNDFLAAAGLTINGGGFNLFQSSNPTAPFDTPGTYDLISYTGSIGGSGGISALSVVNPQAGFSYTFGLDASHANDVDLTIAAVPEPGSLVLLAAGGLVLAAWMAGRRAVAKAA